MKLVTKPSVATACGLIAMVAASGNAQEAPEKIIVYGYAEGSATAPGVDAAREEAAKVPGGTAVVDASQFEDSYALNLRDTLGLVPGVFAQSRWGEEVRLSIRGSGLSRGFHLRGVQLFIDGVPTTLADGSADFQEIDMANAAYIEVFKGANALRYGATSLGGAVNVVTPSGMTWPPGYRINVEGGSFGTLRGHASVTQNLGDVDFYAAATASTVDGWREQSDGRSVRLNGNLGWRPVENVETRFYVTYNNIDQEIPGTLSKVDALSTPRKASPGNLANDYARDMESVRLSNRTAIGLGDGQKIELGAFWNHKELYHPIFQVIDQVSDDFGLNARYTLESDAGHGLVMGVNWRTGEVDAKRYVNLVGKRGALTADALQKADTLEVYGEGRLAAGPFTFVAGGQYVHGNRSVDDFLNPATSDSRTYDAFNPKVGVLWQVTPEAQVYANVSKATELPTFSELVQFPVVGFVPLDPQRSWTVEVGTRGSAGPVEWDFSLYRAWVKGELLQFTTSASIPAATFNADETIHQGIEAGLAATLAEDMVAWGDRLTVRLSYTYSDFHFSGDPQYGDNRIPGQPPHVLTGEMEYRAAGGWSVTPNIEWVPKAGWVDFANSLKADSYAILGMRVSVPVGEKFALYVDGRNLLDKRYIASWSTITDAATVATNVFYPGDGIAVYAGAKARF